MMIALDDDDAESERPEPPQEPPTVLRPSAQVDGTTLNPRNQEVTLLNPARTPEDREPPTQIRGQVPQSSGPVPADLEVRFTNWQPLGQGSQAEAYTAFDAEGNKLTVRVAHFNISIGSNDVDLTEIRNPSLAQVLETGVAQDGREYQILKYIEGEPLSRDLDAGRRLTNDEVRTLVLDLTGALEELNRSRTVHGDVKPENIIDRGVGHPRHRFVLIDFGLTVQTRHTFIGDLAGASPRYSPPERFLGQQALKSDWWSLGMVTAQVLQGRHPLGTAVDLFAVSLAVINHRFDISGVSGSAEQGSVNHRWRDLVHGLLTGPVENRWSAEQVKEWADGGTPAIDRGASGPGISADTPQTPFRVRPIRFAGREFHADPRRIADAFGASWPEAARMLGSPPARAQLVEWSRQFNDMDLIATIEAAANPGIDLDRQISYVISALYKLPVPSSATPRSTRNWYRGIQINSRSIHKVCVAALAHGDQIANVLSDPLDDVETESDLRFDFSFDDDLDDSAPGTEDHRGSPDEPEGAADIDPSVRTAIDLVDGVLEQLELTDQVKGSLSLLCLRLKKGTELIQRGTEGLTPRREDWELTLWKVQLLAALTARQTANTLREQARAARAGRPDLVRRADPSDGPAEHLLATILARRTALPAEHLGTRLNETISRAMASRRRKKQKA